jgi:N utilization substance protein B
MYQAEISREDPETGLPAFWANCQASADVREFATELIRGARSRIEEIDTLLSRYAENWVLSRMAAVDRNILRLAVCEMLFMKRTPPIVVINEAVDIAKKFSTPDSGAFVNGILDRIRKEEMKDET